MRISYDPDADTLAVTLLPGALSARQQEVGPGVILDWDRKGRLTGVEILDARAQYPRAALEQLGDDVEWITLLEAEREGAKEGGPMVGTLRILARTGKIDARKEGRDWLIARHSFWNYLENRSAAGRPGRRRPGPAPKK